jgi:hypothetical protein
MKNIPVYLFLLISINFLMCKKHKPYNGEYEVSGRVLDELTGKTIPYATVGVLERSRDNFSSWGAKTVVSGLADENGWFSFRFPVNEKDNHYELVAKEPHKYFEKSSYPLVSIYSNGKTTMDVKLMPKGYLTFIIKGNKGGVKLNINGGGTFKMNTDTTSTVYKTPLKNSKISYFVYNINNELLYQKSDSIFIPLPPDTAYYLIEF